MLTFYQMEWCPSCHTVRQVMTELGLTYTAVNVANDPDERDDVRAVSGQESVPVLVDGDTVLTDSKTIIEHLRATYPLRDDSSEHAARGHFRVVVKLDEPPVEALRRLGLALADAGVRIVAIVPAGDFETDRLPDGYTLALAASPTAAARVVSADPTAPAAVVTPIAVYATETGSEIAVTKPSAGSWLYGSPEARKVNAALTQRIVEALRQL
jgi:glutaredoxin